jgi:hypothetical protein
MLRDKRIDVGYCETARPRNPCHLQRGIGRADVRVETGTGCGRHVSW